MTKDPVYLPVDPRVVAMLILVWRIEFPAGGFAFLQNDDKRIIAMTTWPEALRVFSTQEIDMLIGARVAFVSGSITGLWETRANAWLDKYAPQP